MSFPRVDFFFEKQLEDFGATKFSASDLAKFMGNLQAIADFKLEMDNSSDKSAPKRLHTTGFNDELIWAQIDRLNEKAVSQLGRRLAELQNIDSIYQVERHPVGPRESKEEDGEEEEVSGKEENEELEEWEELPESSAAESENEEQEETEDRHTSVVDDDFFKLTDLNEFLDEEDAKAAQEDGAGEQLAEDGKPIDLFGTDSEDPETEGMPVYGDFFRKPRSTRKSTQKAGKQLLEDNEDSVEDFMQDMENSEMKKDTQAKLEEAKKYEQENVKERHWSLRGEVDANHRPNDSLLDLEMDFDGGVKLPPMHDEKHSTSIIDLIKKRIQDEDFDDVEKISAESRDESDGEEKTKLEDKKSRVPLSKIYEKEYLSQMSTLVDNDKEINEKHEEITKLLDKLGFYLESLSNFSFKPKRHKEIKIKTMVPSIKMEEAVPFSVSGEVTIAPEEIAQQNRNLKGERELTRTQKRRINKSKRRGNIIEKKKEHAPKEPKKAKYGSTKYMSDLKNQVKSEIERKKGQK